MANTQGFGIQLATGGFSLEANTIFATYAEALVYAQSSAAYVGKVISITSGEQKGTYSIEAVGADAAIKKLGSDIDLSNYVTRGEIASVYKAKGSVATYEDLPSNAQVGDVYNVIDTGKNYVWVENLVDGASGWDDLAGIIDLTPYATIAAVEAHVDTLNGSIATNTGAIATINAALANKVDAVEGSSLIPADKLALIDANAGAISQLVQTDSDLDTRLKTIEGAFKGEGGTIDLGDITAALGDHSTRLVALETNSATKSELSTLQAQVNGHGDRLTAIETLNTEQSSQISGLTTRVESVEKHGEAITNLTTTVNEHTQSLSDLSTAVNTIQGDYLKAADIEGKLDASVYEAKVAELVKADSDNLAAAKTYAEEQAAAAAGAVNTDLLAEVARATAAEEANAAAIAVEKGRLDAILTGEGVSEALDSFKELQAWIETHEGGAADILSAANKAQEEVDALELVVAGIDEAYKAADAAVLGAAKEHVNTELAKLGTAAYKDEAFFASAEALLAVKAIAEAAAPQATTYTKDEVNANIAGAVAAAFEWVDVK